MNQKKIPLRMCIVCKESKPKRELIRLVNIDNNIELDFTGKLNGRGSYICDNIDCFNNNWKNKSLNKCYKHNFSKDTYDLILEKYIEHKEN